MISCVPIMLQWPRLAQLLSAGESGPAWQGPGLMQREAVSNECLCPTGSGLLMLESQLPVVLLHPQRSSGH